MLTFEGKYRLTFQKLKLQERRPMLIAFVIATFFHLLMASIFHIQTLQPGDVEIVFVPSWVEKAECLEIGMDQEEEIDPLFGFPFNEGDR